MFCNKCGNNNAEGSAFCQSCGAPLAANTQFPDTHYTANTASQAPPQVMPQDNAGQQFGYTSPVVKKSKKGLVIGIISGCVVILAAVLLYLFVFTGNPMAGQWCSKESGMVLEFKDGGKVDIYSISDTEHAKYEFNAGKKEGTITRDSGELEFALEGDSLTLHDSADIPFVKAEKDLNIEEFVSQYGSTIEGLWYETTGMGGTLEFKSGGTVTASVFGMTLDGTYVFDTSSNKGTISLMGTDTEFELNGGDLDLDGTKYTKEVVEQQSLDDLMEGLGDTLESPGV